MAHTSAEEALIETAREYFRRVDQGRADLVELFTEDVEVYFPKFGVAKGKAAFGELATGLFRRIASITHDLECLHFVANGDDVVAEGFSSGSTRGGASWAGGTTPAGRFCNVFRFRDGKIDRVHIHLDPDYGAEDADRFSWGRERAW